MTNIPDFWLKNRNAILIGNCENIAAIKIGLEAAGAKTANCDFASSHEIARNQIENAANQLGGGIDILIHSFASPSDGFSHEYEFGNWREGIMQSLDSKFFYASTLANIFLSGGKRPTNIFIVPPHSGNDIVNDTAYGALDNLTKTLAVEWALDGIRTNSIISKNLGESLSPAQAKSMGAYAAYLCSDYAAYITGTLSGIAI